MFLPLPLSLVFLTALPTQLHFLSLAASYKKEEKKRKGRDNKNKIHIYFKTKPIRLGS